MKKLLFIFALGCFSANLSAQIDRSNGSSTIRGMGIPAERGVPAASQSTSHSLSILDRNGLFAPVKDSVSFSEEKKPLNMTQDNGLMTFKQENFKPKAFKDKDTKEEFKKDQYLGDFKTGGEFVEVYCKDHEYVDGDKVRIYVNGVVVEQSISLGGRYHPVLVRLKNGFNTIEFEALNQGTSGPNTAELRVLDDIGKTITENEWNLMTGAKANIIVVKE